MAAMRTAFPIIAALVLTACNQPSGTPESAATSEETGAPAPDAEPLTSLVGEYRLAGLDGRDFNESYGIAVSITDGRIDFPNCKQIGWEYTFEEGKLTTERSPPGGPDAKPCSIDLPVRTLQFVTAIDAAEKAARTPANGIELTGDLRSVTLFSQ